MSFRRGDLVAAGAYPRLLVWSVGEVDLLCLPLGTTWKPRWGVGVVRIGAAQVGLRLGRATADMIRLARQMVEELPRRAAAAQVRRVVVETIDELFLDAIKPRGRQFWFSPDEPAAPGCSWVLGAPGR